VAQAARGGKTLDQFQVVCGGSWARVYIRAWRKTLGNVGHAHFARPSRLQQPTIRERRSVFLCSKKISSAPRLNSTNHGACRVETSEEEEERVCGTSLLTHLPSCATPHLIYWSTSLPTFHVGLNLAPTSCLYATNKLGCMSHGLTHMGFEIS
jgi:hypothetical protein